MGAFDRLAAVLYEGDVVASDFKTMPGTDANADRDRLSQSLLASMERMGLIVDGRLVNKLEPKG